MSPVLLGDLLAYVVFPAGGVLLVLGLSLAICKAAQHGDDAMDRDLCEGRRHREGRGVR
jgi:hypothetical protein